MKLNQIQRYALMAWLVKSFPEISEDYSVLYSFDEFCDGEIREWRIISKYGMAGKIWNNDDRIYISGHSGGELDGFEGKIYKAQQKEINALNVELKELMGILSI